MTVPGGEPEEWYPLRGEIYWVDHSPARGSEQEGRRPALVISPDPMNRRTRTVIIAALTTKVYTGPSRSTVYLPAGQPLEKEGTVLAFQLMTAAKDRLENLAGTLAAEQMKQVDQALAFVFGLQLMP